MLTTMTTMGSQTQVRKICPLGPEDVHTGYKKAILREFSWMENKRRVINKLMGNATLSMKEAWVLKKNSQRIGMQVGLKESLLLLKKVIVKYLAPKYNGVNGSQLL